MCNPCPRTFLLPISPTAQTLQIRRTPHDAIGAPMPQMQEERGRCRSRDSRSRSSSVRVCATARLTPCSRPRAQRLFRLKELAVPQARRTSRRGSRRRCARRLPGTGDARVGRRSTGTWMRGGSGTGHRRAQEVLTGPAHPPEGQRGTPASNAMRAETPQALRPRVLCGLTPQFSGPRRRAKPAVAGPLQLMVGRDAGHTMNAWGDTGQLLTLSVASWHG